MKLQKYIVNCNAIRIRNIAFSMREMLKMISPSNRNLAKGTQSTRCSMYYKHGNSTLDISYLLATNIEM